MSQMLSLKDAERKAWTIYFEDGFWDIFFGLLFLGGGLRALTDNLWSYLLVLAGILSIILGRKYITVPRLGAIKFGPKREKRRSVLMALIVTAVALTFLALLLPLLGVSPGPNAGLIFAIIVPMIFVIMAYLMDFKRLYGYAALAAIFIVLTETVSMQAGAVAQIVAGLIALIVGLWHLLRFLRRYPLPQEESIAEADYNGRF